jgi:hypothetical protein
MLEHDENRIYAYGSAASRTTYSQQVHLHLLLLLPSSSHERKRNLRLFILVSRSVQRFHIAPSAQPQRRRIHQHKTAVSPHMTSELHPDALTYRKSTQPFSRTERDSEANMGKADAHVLKFKTSAPSRTRPILAAILLVLCVPIFFYHLVPSFTHATDDFLSVLTMQLRGQASRADFCTSEVGSTHCCSLFLDAAPCLDECRKQYVDKVAYMLTKEYDECSDKCLVHYNAACQRPDNGNPFAATRKQG